MFNLFNSIGRPSQKGVKAGFKRLKSGQIVEKATIQKYPQKRQQDRMTRDADYVDILVHGKTRFEAARDKGTYWQIEGAEIAKTEAITKAQFIANGNQREPNE